MEGFRGKMLVAMALKRNEGKQQPETDLNNNIETDKVINRIDEDLHSYLEEAAEAVRNIESEMTIENNYDAIDSNRSVTVKKSQDSTDKSAVEYDNQIKSGFQCELDEAEEAIMNIESELQLKKNTHMNSESQGLSQLNDLMQSVDAESIFSDTYEYDDGDFYDLDDDVKDPDWRVKRKRDLYSSSDSEVNTSDSDTGNTVTTEVMQFTADPYNEHNVSDENQSEDETHIMSKDQDTETVERRDIVQVPEIVEREEIVQTINTGHLPKTFKRNKKLRMQGMKYTGFGKDDTGKSKYYIERSERQIHPRSCTGRCVKHWGGRQCSQIDEQTRSEIFKSFWTNMSWDEKKVYVLSLVTKKEVTRRTSAKENSRRSFSYTYHLRKDDKRYVVCKSLFLATLSLKEDTVYNWLAEEPTHGIPKTPPVQKKGNNDKQEARASAVNFLKEIPKMPSHYCRARTSKLYLETSLASMRDLYKHYKEVAASSNQPVYGITQFTKLFHDMNLSFYKPKKDQCDLCLAFKVKTADENTYNEHIRRKTEATKSKDEDKEKACKEGKQIVITMDLQSLLLCPKLEASCLFYKTKLCCHNFTLFDLSTKSVMNYFWNETAADLSASTFATCVVDYLENLDLTGIEKIILYSDGCTYQNRNVTMSCALLQFAVRNKIEIEQKYLEKGHTYMECDSVHATIGRKVKNTDVYIPQKYVEIIQNSRENEENRYMVKYVDYQFFKDYSKLAYFTSIRPGHGVGSPVVTDLRVLKYTVDGDILYKLNYSDTEFSELRKPRNSTHTFNADQAMSAYTKPLPLKKTKYQHLQQIKAVIPKDYHAYYDNLPHVDS